MFTEIKIVPMKNENKLLILAEIISYLENSVKKLKKSLTETEVDINDAPCAMQSHSDTTRSQLTPVFNKIQESLVSKQKDLVLLKEIQKDDRIIDLSKGITVNVVVLVKKNNKFDETYYLMPVDFSLTVSIDNNKVICFSSLSPLGQNFIGKKKGEIFDFNVGINTFKFEILDFF